MPLALITGASTGIGRATALRLAASGWTVLAGVRDPAAGERLVADAAATPQPGHAAAPGSATTGRSGGSVIPLILDVTDSAQVAAARERVDQEAARPGVSSHGGLDALVNNAGIAVAGPLEIVSAEDLRRQFDVNVFAQVAVTRELLPALRGASTPPGKRGGRAAGGRIVFVSSIGGRVTTPFMAPYAASKYAIEAIGDALRVELHSSGVKVALVEPGSVATPIWDKGRVDAEGVVVPDELQDAYGRVPAAMKKALEDTARRGVPPEQVAETIERALTASRMKARYLVGRDARAMLIARRLLPDLVFDRVVKRALGV